ncbi:tRNA (cytosine(34)-C(5))-methyltransferase [Conglomerata obtusa]
MKNIEHFKLYYQKNLDLNENDFTALIDSLITPLPLTFRILDKNLYSPIESCTSFTKTIFPDVFAHPRTTYKQCPIRPLLIKFSYIGHVYRQELASMLPVHLLDLHNTHFVLDMCAAPGSKSTQIVKIVRDGLVVLNDFNRKRVDVLRSNCNSFSCGCLIITNNDARVYPNIYLEDISNGHDHELTNEINETLIKTNKGNENLDFNESNVINIDSNALNSIDPNKDNNIANKTYDLNCIRRKVVKYDRILCDVPCSGDGTARKNPDILQKWNKNDGLTLNKTQFSILKRGLFLLKENGILVYSTCSFNPLENECVVQRAVLECDCEIIEHKNINGLIVRKGLRKWDPCVKRKENNEWLFPIEKDIGLEKCVRIYPHDQDTGGFFMAVLRKRSKSKISDDKDSSIENKNANDIIYNYDTINDATIINNDIFYDNNDSSNENKLDNETHVDNKTNNSNDNKTINFSNSDNNITINTNNSDYNIEHSSININSNGINNGNDNNNSVDNNKEHSNNKNSSDHNKTSNINNSDDNKEHSYRNINIDDNKEHFNNINSDYNKTSNSIFDTNSPVAFRLSKYENPFYTVNDEIKQIIEKQYEIKIKEKLISQSKTNNVINLINETVFKISQSDNKALKVISVGFKAFLKNGFKGIELENYRAKPGVLELFIKNTNKIINLNKNDSLLLLQNEFVNMNETLIDNQKQGPFVLCLYNVEGIFSAWAGKNKISLLIDKNYKKALIEIVNFK